MPFLYQGGELCEWIFKNFRDFRKKGNQGTKNQYFIFRRVYRRVIKFENIWIILEDTQKLKDERIKKENV